MRTQVCGHCGRTDVGSFFAGYAMAHDTYLCHPNVDGRPDCYRLVTVYGHPHDDCWCDGELGYLECRPELELHATPHRGCILR